MNIQKDIKISSVNMEDRKKIDIHPGDTVRVWQKVEEKGKIRLQPFEGIVLARKHGTEPGATFTVRRVTDGMGVEKIYPLFSPMIDRIEVVKRVKTRRAKLYHIREKATRAIRRQMRKMQLVKETTLSDIEEKDRVTKEVEETEKREVEEATKKQEEQVVTEEKVEETAPAEETKEEPKEEVAEGKKEESKEADSK